MCPTAAAPGRRARTSGWKISCTKPMPFSICSFGAIGGDDTGRFLPAVLQGVQPEIGKLGGFGMAEDAADTAVIVKVIVVEDGSCLSGCGFAEN